MAADQLRLFLLWLHQPATLWSVVLPFVVIVVLMARFKQARASFVRLALLGLLCTPISLKLSYWSEKGFHVAPAVLMLYVALAWVKRLDMRRDWAATAAAIWVSTIVPDLLAGAPPGGERQITWYWGVGGYGAMDGLLLYPVLFTSTLALLQGGWLHPRRWIQPRWRPAWMRHEPLLRDDQDCS